MKDYALPLWSFTRTGEDGTTDTKTFEAVEWTIALQEFVNFLKGCGYILDGDSVQIKELHEDERWFGNYCSPVEDDNSCGEWGDEIEWDDCYCKREEEFFPSFEGNPEECAFNHVTQDMAERALDEIVQRLINKNKGE